MADHSSLRIAVIGAGPAGLAAGHELLAHGFTNFTIFEATDAVGGTWHIHTYPGLACDVWAHAYTFSYRPNTDWSANFVDQPEIESYLQMCATEFGLDEHIKLDTRIASAHYEGEGSWQLDSTEGERFECDVIINAMGNQHTPLYPDVPGIDEFEGESFHGTRWDHSVELKDKRVVIVGSAASAVQIVPEVAKVAGELTVLCASLSGAGLAFLWFNAYPAEVFMGDVGALALGAALGTIAVIVRQEIVLLVMGGVFVVETLSVILQVTSFKLTGKRIFRMAPLHHHYELKGWKENQVVVRFWIITMMLVLVGLSTLKLR